MCITSASSTAVYKKKLKGYFVVLSHIHMTHTNTLSKTKTKSAIKCREQREKKESKKYVYIYELYSIHSNSTTP